MQAAVGLPSWSPVALIDEDKGQKEVLIKYAADMEQSLVFIIVVSFLCVSAVRAAQAGPGRILIHMKTSLAEDDAQICAVPNVAWAAVKAGHPVTILVDASAVTRSRKASVCSTISFGRGGPPWIARSFRSANGGAYRNRWPSRWTICRMITASTSIS